MLDNVFLAEPVDTYYQNRREHGTIVTVACTRPVETCFCGTFGIDAGQCRRRCERLQDRGRALSGSQDRKGRKAAGDPRFRHRGRGRKARGSAEGPHQGAHGQAAAGQSPARRLSARTRPAEFFNAPEWKELSESCLGCGTCTFVCPTCQCYDIRDFNTGHGVKRFRCWDSCMYSDFTKMAAGQPRTDPAGTVPPALYAQAGVLPRQQRRPVRLRRLRPLPEPAAPSPMNIVKVMKTLGGGKQNG